MMGTLAVKGLNCELTSSMYNFFYPRLLNCAAFHVLNKNNKGKNMEIFLFQVSKEKTFIQPLSVF